MKKSLDCFLSSRKGLWNIIQVEVKMSTTDRKENWFDGPVTESSKKRGVEYAGFSDPLTYLGQGYVWRNKWM
jgi:hypothetical protein